jgi:hypothetical protein
LPESAFREIIEPTAATPQQQLAAGMIFISKSWFVAFVTIYISAVVFCALPVSAQTHTSEARPARNLEQLVRAVMRNEVESQRTDTSLWCYHQQHQEDGKPSKTLEVCQTKQGDLERTVAVNGRELNREQQQAEDRRLQKLLSQPEQLKAKQKKAREDGEQMESLLKAFPDAFHFQLEDESVPCVRIKFKPNPNFHPSTRALMVFHHMEGNLVVDEKERRIAEIDGQLSSEVKFGAGLLGHLDRGGTFHVKQQDVGSGHWEMTLMNVHMNGKVLFFKSISVLEEDSFSDYTPLPSGAGLKQAADFLTKGFNVHIASTAPSSVR